MRGVKPEPKAFTVIQGGIVDTYPFPKTLPKDCLSDWNLVTSDLLSRGLINEAMLGPVETYCRSLWIAREATKAIEQHGLFIPMKGGGSKSNPAATALQKAQVDITRLAAELGLTPSSRSRRGLEGEGVGMGGSDADGLV